ncbi:MAG: carbon starvation protein A, partial [bacterium]
MSAALVAVLCCTILALGYRFYGDHIAYNVTHLDASRPTPAHTMEDGVDYVPSNKWVLFGHHFASISGLGPILGPAIAVIWGWLPAVLWVVFGTLLVGAVHDYTTMYVSVRNDARSIGDVTKSIINQRSRILFLILIFFLISLAMGVFAYVIGVLFAKLYPESVIPVFALMVIAMGMGVATYKGNQDLQVVTVIGLILLAFSMWGGLKLPNVEFGVNTWTYILMAYAFVASVLPVWFLLQPRDYLNSFLLYAGLILLYGGLFWMNPTISAPAVTSSTVVTDLPPLLPVLFITIACGAVSGFHSLVSSGTTAKQLDSENDGKMVGFGGMVAEGVLALIVVLACVAGLGSFDGWLEHYSSWAAASDGLKPKLDAFITGGGHFIHSFGQYLGLSARAGKVFISLVVVSFAMTTLDSGTRLLRYNIEEIADSLTEGEQQSPPIVNRWTSSFLAVVAIGFFALLEVNGQPAGLFLWVLFGASNQLLASLGLLTVTVYLYKRNRPIIYTIVPMLFMVVITTLALLGQFFKQMPKSLRYPLADLLGVNPRPEQPGSWVIFGMV